MPGVVRKMLMLQLTNPQGPLLHRTRPSAQVLPAAVTRSGAAAQLELGRLLLLSLWIGAIPAGGKVIPYMFAEVVQRRRWMNVECFTEWQLLTRMLPGSSGSNMWMCVVQALRGSWPSLCCLAAFLLPGSAMMGLLTLLLLGLERPAWLYGAVRGAAAASISLLLTWALHLVPSSRQARGWQVFALLAFVANGLLAVSVFVVLLMLGPLALACNRPKA